MQIVFKSGVFLALQLFITLIATEGKSLAVSIDRSAFYKALAGNDVAKVNDMLIRLNGATIPEKTAYEGALLMKKAGLVKKITEKLSLFKSGRLKLEEAIKNNDGNTEYHFLRLIIQENAPKILRYKSDIGNDTEIVRTSFKNLSPALQQIVKDYSKNSKVLKPTDF